MDREEFTPDPIRKSPAIYDRLAGTTIVTGGISLLSPGFHFAG
jgi:hypothetical protein